MKAQGEIAPSHSSEVLSEKTDVNSGIVKELVDVKKGSDDLYSANESIARIQSPLISTID